jgi:pyruvate/2-oxoglutarate dehydrogenase complex dihydrolipoamide acyltransferase (E2) component
MQQARYALAALLTLAAPAWAAPGDALVVAEQNVNVRAGPGLDSSVVMRVQRDQLVIELERQGDWVRGEIAGTGRQDGWIHGSLLARPGGERVAAPLRDDAADPVQEAQAPRQTPEPAAAPPAPQPTPEVVSRPAPIPAPPEPATTAGDLPPEAGGLARDAGAEPTTGSGATGGIGAVGVAAAAPRTDPEPEAVAEPAPAAGPAAARLRGIEQFRENVSYLNSRALEVAGIELFTAVEAVGSDVVRVHATEAWANVPPGGQESFLSTLLDRWLAAKGGAPASVQIANVLGEVVNEKSRP